MSNLSEKILQEDYPQEKFWPNYQGINQEILLAYLSTKINLNPRRTQLILANYENLVEAVHDNFGKLNFEKEKWLQKWQKPEYLNSDLQQFEQTLNFYQVKLLTSLNPLYPNKLKILQNYPIVLYYQGNLDLIYSKQTITVVGSRMVEKYSQIILEKILKPACKLGVVVVSGLAIGLDSLAHQNALEANSTTIGVIGSGLDEASFYPQSNLNLKKQILEKNGLVLSEYFVETRASKFTFPARNRILAALSEVTWVVQASPKSGSLITGNKARDLSKTVATTPASILSESFAGNIELLKNGANMITQTEDILQLLNLKTHALYLEESFEKNELTFESKEEETIYKILDLQGQNVEEISLKSGLEVNQIVGHLTMLELNNFAINMGENVWIKGV